jgi:transcriptional regulator with XRE-family HTH domain
MPKELPDESKDDSRKQPDEIRRKELADFLKTRRARIKPPESALPSYTWRRTPGLRREEIAEMVGVSASWYTWLEQGRNIQPSTEFLLRLSQVLRLSAFETRHLFDLAGKAPPAELIEPQEEVPESLKELVQNVLLVPALVVGVRSDLLLWNRHFKKRFYDMSSVPKERRTLLDLVFTQNIISRSDPEWMETAQRVVAEFRGSIGKHIGSPWVKDLIVRLQKESPEFAKIWQMHDVQERKKSRIFKTRFGKKGTKSFTRSIYIPAEAENLRLMIFTPLSHSK